MELFLLQPSCNIGQLSNQFRYNLPHMFNHLIRGLGTHRVDSPDWLSIVMFKAPCLERMIAIGEANAKKQLKDIPRVVEKD